MTPEEVFVEFLASFGDKNGDGIITKEEWDDYYAAVSSNVDNDEHFCLLMRNAWKLDDWLSIDAAHFRLDLDEVTT